MKITIKVFDDDGNLLGAANEVPTFEMAEEKLGQLERLVENQLENETDDLLEEDKEDNELNQMEDYD